MDVPGTTQARATTTAAVTLSALSGAEDAAIEAGAQDAAIVADGQSPTIPAASRTGSGVCRVAVAVAVAVAVLLATACSRPVGDGTGLRGEPVEVLAVWSGVEQERFTAVLDAFSARTGASVTFTSVGHDVAAALDARLAAGQPPDLALLPQPALLREEAHRGAIVPVDDVVGDLVTRNYGPRWRQLATVDGRLYGVWFKAADKSLIWYDIGVFERAGVAPPDDVDGLIRVARAVSRAGVAAFSVAGADAWTLTDWFENLYLARWGPDRYEQLAEHRIPWTDPTVIEALRLFVAVLAPDLVAGGPDRALRTGFEASVTAAFASPPGAAMVMEGDFVAGAVAGGTHAALGVDVDAFPFPTAGWGGPVLMGGGDVAVLVRSSPASRALLRFLATPEAAAVWARQGGYLSPNLNLDLTTYPDPLTRSMARSILEAGDDFRFDLSDLQPVAFGSTPGAGMPAQLQSLLASGDVDGTAARLEEAAVAAYGR